MMMSSEPIVWLKTVKDVAHRDVCNRFEVRRTPVLFAADSSLVSVLHSAARPVVRQEDVDVVGYLREEELVVLTDVVRSVSVCFVAALLRDRDVPVLELVRLVYPRPTSDAQAAKVHDTRMPQVPYVMRDPAPVKQLPEVGRCLMVAANKDRRYRRSCTTFKVVGEVSHAEVLWGDGHEAEVSGVADGLEIAAAQDEVDLVSLCLLNVLDYTVDCVQLSVETANNSNFHFLKRRRTKLVFHILKSISFLKT